MKKAFLSLLAVVVVGFVVLCHFEIRAVYRCKYCLSTKNVSQWWLGIQPLGYPLFGVAKPFTWAAVPLTKPLEHFSPSVAVPLFPAEHRHEWFFAQASPYFLFGRRWAGCILGAQRRVSPFAYAFMNNPDFRVYAEDQIRNGQLSAHEAAQLFTFIPQGEDQHDPRFVRSVLIVREFIATHPNRMFEESFNSGFGRGAV